jgi:hypothetical protein
MRLTKETRQAFVVAAMQDVPNNIPALKEQAANLCVEDSIERMPVEVRAIFLAHRKVLAPFFKTTTYYGNSLGGVSVYGGGYYEPSPQTREKLNPILQQIKDERERREALEIKLMAVANGCSTRKALADALPEFAKYLPAETPPPSANLPALANVVAEFTKAGWPKGQQPAPTKPTTSTKQRKGTKA